VDNRNPFNGLFLCFHYLHFAVGLIDVVTADRMMNCAWRSGKTRSGSYGSSCSQYCSEE